MWPPYAMWNKTFITSHRTVILCCVMALVIRIVTLLAFQLSVFFMPSESSGHDRSIYLQAIERVAAGQFWPAGAFEFLPLYPWVVGILGSIFTTTPTAIALFGIFCDVLTTGLIVLLARRIGAHEGIATLAGIAYAAYPLAVIYSLLTMPNTLNALGVTAWVYASSVVAPWTKKRALGLGLLAGVVSLGFAGMLLISLPIAIYKSLQSKSFVRLAILLAAMALPIAPVAIHNSRAEGTLVLLTTHGGFNSFMGNHEQATGYPLRVMNFRMTAKSMLEDAHRYAEQQTGQTLTRSGSSDWWQQQARRFWREHPATALGLTLKKVLLFWNHRDVDDLRILEQIRLTDAFFRHLIGTPFFVIGLLGLIGLIFARQATVPRAALLLGMIGLVMFFITARYRLTFAPLMLALGAGGIAPLKENFSKRWWVLLPLTVIVFYPFPFKDQRPVDHYNTATQLMHAQRDDDAIAIIESGLAIDPNFADLHMARGSWMFKRGRFAEAAQSYRIALSINPHHPVAWYNFALSLARHEHYCEARDALQVASQRGIPLDPNALNLLRELNAYCTPSSN